MSRISIPILLCSLHGRISIDDLYYKIYSKKLFKSSFILFNMMKTFLCRSSVRREMRDGENGARHTGYTEKNIMPS